MRLGKYYEAITLVQNAEKEKGSEHAGDVTIKAALEMLEIGLKGKSGLVKLKLNALRMNERLAAITGAGFVFLILVGVVLWLGEEYRNFAYLSGLAGLVQGGISGLFHRRIQGLTEDLEKQVRASEGYYALLVAKDACGRIVSDDQRDFAYQQLARDVLGGLDRDDIESRGSG